MSNWYYEWLLTRGSSIFWQNDSSGVNQRPDFYSTIATKVHVYRQSIDRLSTHSVTLAPRAQSEEGAHTLPLDVLVYCTGWTPISPRYSPASALQLGLPVSLTEADPKTLAKWQELEDAKDHKVLSSFSSLRHPPVYRKAQSSHTPFRLYKAMVPASDALDHSIVFLGKMVVGNNFRTAEVQAFWAVAYLDGKLKCEKPAMEDDIAETIAWCRRRYLNKGQLGSWYYFDVVSYTDMLLAQLGLSSHRRKGWFRNLFAPCMASDLKDLESEYKALYGV